MHIDGRDDEKCKAMPNGQHPEGPSLNGLFGCEFNLSFNRRIALLCCFERRVDAIDMLAVVLRPPQNHARQGQAKEQDQQTCATCGVAPSPMLNRPSHEGHHQAAHGQSQTHDGQRACSEFFKPLNQGH